jgi:hypothetical protein
MSQKSYFSKNSFKEIIEESLIYIKNEYEVDINKKQLLDHLVSKDLINQSLYDLVYQTTKVQCNALIKKNSRCNNSVCENSIYCALHTLNKPVLSFDQYSNIKQLNS